MLNETVHSSTALELGAAILQQLPRDISQEIALKWIYNKKGLGKVLREALMDQIETSAPADKVQTRLLKQRSTTNVAAEEAFKANDFFKAIGQPDGIKFWLGSNFKKLFLTGPGKIGLYIPAAILGVNKLGEASVDGPILAALGGNDLVKTSLAYMAQLIKAQPKGEEGVLLTNGWANIFCVEDGNGVLWAVSCHWDSGRARWDVEAYPVTYPGWWYADDQFFSPAVLVP